MHKIRIYYSDSEQENLEYDNFQEFITNYISCDINNYKVEVTLDEDIISFDECFLFIELILGIKFDNPDNCTKVHELLDWLKSLQFISFLDDEMS